MLKSTKIYPWKFFFTVSAQLFQSGWTFGFQKLLDLKFRFFQFQINIFLNFVVINLKKKIFIFQVRFPSRTSVRRRKMNEWSTNDGDTYAMRPKSCSLFLLFCVLMPGLVCPFTSGEGELETSASNEKHNPLPLSIEPRTRPWRRSMTNEVVEYHFFLAPRERTLVDRLIRTRREK